MEIKKWAVHHLSDMWNSKPQAATSRELNVTGSQRFSERGHGVREIQKATWTSPIDDFKGVES